MDKNLEEQVHAAIERFGGVVVKIEAGTVIFKMVSKRKAKDLAKALRIGFGKKGVVNLMNINNVGTKIVIEKL